MPDIPQLPVPDYKGLNREFRNALLNPANSAFRYDENHHPNFAAYLCSNSNEMVTWGILAIGEWLCARNTDWIRSMYYYDFFSEELKLYLNAHNATQSEYWYLFYANTLASSVARTLFEKDSEVFARMAQASDSMIALAKKINYDFNDQGYDFPIGKSFTNADIFRQSDSIAGFAYNTLFAALQADHREYLTESAKTIGMYQEFQANPRYEISNGSAGILAAAWLNVHGHKNGIHKIAGYVFDHDEGPLQTGR